MSDIIREYNEKVKKYKVPSNSKNVYFYQPSKSKYMRHYIWIDNEILNIFIAANFLFTNIYYDGEVPKLQRTAKELFPKEDYSDLIYTLNLINWFPHDKITHQQQTDLLFNDPIQIPLNQIQYFKEDGDIHHELRITGGGGGGSSIGGAVAGGLIAGGIGAIIGSRKKNNEIKSENVEIDTRRVILKYTDENKNNREMVFHHKDIDIFRNLIPEKELGYKPIISNTQTKSQPIPDQIEKLFQLKERGILTEDEFIEKKRELLNKM